MPKINLERMPKNPLFSEPSPKGRLNASDILPFLKNAAWFTIPVVIIYLASILGTVQQTGHIVSVKDFVPSNATYVAMIVYMLNRAIDILRRAARGK